MESSGDNSTPSSSSPNSKQPILDNDDDVKDAADEAITSTTRTNTTTVEPQVESTTTSRSRSRRTTATTTADLPEDLITSPKPTTDGIIIGESASLQSSKDQRVSNNLPPSAAEGGNTINKKGLRISHRRGDHDDAAAAAAAAVALPGAIAMIPSIPEGKARTLSQEGDSRTKPPTSHPVAVGAVGASGHGLRKNRPPSQVQPQQQDITTTDNPPMMSNQLPEQTHQQQAVQVGAVSATGHGLRKNRPPSQVQQPDAQQQQQQDITTTPIMAGGLLEQVGAISTTAGGHGLRKNRPPSQITENAPVTTTAGGGSGAVVVRATGGRGLGKNLGPTTTTTSETIDINSNSDPSTTANGGGSGGRGGGGGKSSSKEITDLEPRTSKANNIITSPPTTSFKSVDLELQQPSSSSVLSSGANHIITSPATSFKSTSADNNNNGSSLVEATRVNSIPNILDYAEQVPTEELEQRQLKAKKEQQCRRVGYGVILISCLVLTVGILAAVLTRKSSNNDNDNTTEQPPIMMPTMAPSTMPSFAPTGPLDVLLSDLPESTIQQLNNNTTPQWKAYDWLLHHSKLMDMKEWKKKQLYALATFFYAMGGDSGAWPQAIEQKWLQEDKNECYWFSTEFGIFGNDTKYTGDQVAHNKTPCNDNGVFQSLVLGELNLHYATTLPYVPPEIALLTSLSVLALPFFGINNFTFDEVIPSEFYQLSKLEVLNINTNYMTGTIPSELGLMTSLTELLLYENRFTGSIPSEFGQLSAMEYLYLHTNYLTGGLPSQLGRMTNMKELILSKNPLNSTIPKEFGGMSRMEYLSLTSNNLFGAIPSQLGSMTDMIEMNLFHNNLRQPIPSQLGLMSNMILLDMNYNELHGDIPSQLGKATNLLDLRLAVNYLSGPIPSQLARLTNLAGLELQANILSEAIPTSFGLMKNLTFMGLHDNYLAVSQASWAWRIR